MDWEKEIDKIADDEIEKHGDLPQEGHGYEPGSPLAILSEYFGRRLTTDELFILNSMAEMVFGKGQGRLVLLEIFARQAPELIEGMGYHSYPHDESHKINSQLSFSVGFIYGYLTKQELEP